MDFEEKVRELNIVIYSKIYQNFKTNQLSKNIDLWLNPKENNITEIGMMALGEVIKEQLK